MLATAAAKLRASGSSLGPEQAAALEAEAGTLDEAVNLMSPASYNPASRKRLHYESNLRRRRRQ